MFLVMISRSIFLLFLLAFLQHRAAYDIRSVRLTLMNGWRLQCTATTCLSYRTLTALNVRQYQMSCLNEVQCKAASFQQTNSSCQLFGSGVNSNNNLVIHAGIITMLIIS